MFKRHKKDETKKSADKDKGKDEKPKKRALEKRARNTILVIILFALTLLTVVAFFGQAGVFGQYFLKGLDWLLGGGKYLTPFVFLTAALSVLAHLKKPLWLTLIGVFLLTLSTVSFLGMIHQNGSGGVVGNFFGKLALRYFNFAGAMIVIFALFLISLVLVFNLSFGFLFRKEKKEEEAKEEAKDETAQPSLGFNNIDKKKISFFDRFKKGETKILRRPIFRLKKLDAGETISGVSEQKTSVLAGKEEGYNFPPLDLLIPELLDKDSVKKAEISANIETIKNTLENFGIPVTMGEVNVGPTVTQYTLKPSQGIKLSQIVTLQNDLALALAAHPLRIEAPIPGKSLAGIEVPNKNKHIVKLRDLLEDKAYEKAKNYLAIPLGRNVAGEPIYDNLARMPHILIAGATGTGKSVAIHNILTAFLYQNSPRTLKLILIDPKRVELTSYNGIPHLLTPVVTDPQKAINSMKWAISQMEQRYELLAQVGARDILSYNDIVSKSKKKQQEKTETEHKPLPYIVIVIDELADIMMSYARETETAIVRLAQMARAVGIHLILSTQRPSVEVITGLIKANITFRIAFQVASQIDSRTIIDRAGAEKLLGNGDMLYQTGDTSKPRRIQGPFVADREVKKVAEFLKKQTYEDDEEGEIDLGVRVEENASIDTYKDYEFEDALYAEAKKVVMESKKASASFLQRRLRIGYARAARILDMLEQKGVIGPLQGSRAREILIRKEENEF